MSEVLGLDQPLDPAGCALIIVDVQNDFCHPEGRAAKAGLDIAGVRAIIPNVLTLIDAAREAGVPRIYLRGEHSRWFNTPAWLRRGKAGKSLDVAESPIVEAGSWGAEFYQVSPREDELVIIKHRYSGFSYTPLELALQALETRSVVLCGTATNVCVEATARDAIMKGYYPLLVQDCLAGGHPELHDAALRDMAEYVGAIVSIDQVRHRWMKRVSAGR